MPEVGTPLDPLDAQFYELDIPGIAPKTFQFVRMPPVTAQVSKSFETAANGQPTVRRSVGRGEPGAIVEVSGGATSDMALDTWLKNVIEKGIGAAGADNEKDATLNAYDTSTALIASWKLVGCVLTSLAYGSLLMGGGGHLDVHATFDVLSIERTK